MINKINNKEMGKLLTVLIASVVGLLFFSCHTSPLYPNFFGYDSAIFSLLGKGIVEGKNLYVDLFDHKGPIIFFINALGHLLGGRGGIFFIQCVSMLITVTFLFFTGRQLMKEKKYSSFIEMIFPFAGFFAAFFIAFQKGNLTEEYSLPFISGCCYMFIKYTANIKETSEHPIGFAVFYGVSLAFLSMLRLNNAVTVGAGVLYIFICLIIKKQYKNLLWNLLAGIVGMAIVFVPVFLYFYVHDSFDEMIYAAFIHNFVIAGNTARSSEVFVPYIPMFICAVILGWKIIKTRAVDSIDSLFAVIFALNLAALLIANRFMHYFVIFYPIYFLFLCRYIKPRKDWIFSVAVVLTMLLNTYQIADATMSSVKLVHINGNVRYSTVSADMTKIPENERDSVIGFEIQSADYLAGNIVPCYKYYTLQNTWSITNPQIAEDFVSYVADNTPLWLIMSKDHTNEELNEIINEEYGFQFENKYMTFYRLK